MDKIEKPQRGRKTKEIKRATVHKNVAIDYLIQAYKSNNMKEKETYIEKAIREMRKL